MATRNKKTVRRKAAATTDILQGSSKSRGAPARWKPYYDRLILVRQHLVAQQDDLVKDANEEQPSFSLHMADAATDSFDRDLALSQASAKHEALYEIDAALDRIQNRCYGICELTGESIPPARLDAIPWTRFSLEAEELLEKQGAVTRARLSPTEAVVPSHSAGPEEDHDLVGDKDDRA